LIGPIDANLSVEDLAAVESLECSLGSTHVNVLDEPVVEATVLIIAIRNNFNMLDGTGDGEDFGEHVLGDTRAQVSDIKMGTPLHLQFTHLKTIKMSGTKIQSQGGFPSYMSFNDAQYRSLKKTYRGISGTPHRTHLIHDSKKYE
jgi:hypothetical protein